MFYYPTRLDLIPSEPLTDRTIVLDLDETLVHTFEDLDSLKRLRIFHDPELLDLRERTYVLSLDDVVTRRGSGIETKMWGVTRPHLKEFLLFCFTYFKIVAVWSAGQKRYAESIVDFIFSDLKSPRVVYSWNECDRSSIYLKKPLIKMIEQEKLSDIMSLHSTIVLDDKTTTFSNNFSNGILVPVYHPEPSIRGIKQDDIFLKQMMTWLMKDEIRSASDIRMVDKTNITRITPDKLYKFPHRNI